MHLDYTKCHTYILCENICLPTFKHRFQLLICHIVTSCKEEADLYCEDGCSANLASDNNKTDTIIKTINI